MSCISPHSRSAEAKSVRVQVIINGETVSSASLWFRYMEHGSVSSISPSFGSTMGGTKVNIFGRNFKKYDKLMCKFGNLPPVRATFVAARCLLCLTPPHYAARPVEVEVTMNGQDYTLGRKIFIYRKPLMLTSIWPTSGSANGNTEISAFGSFEESSDLMCAFGSKFTLAEFLSTTEISCISPANKPDRVPFRITYGRNLASSLTSNMTYFNFNTDLYILAFYPKTSLTYGGTPVFVSVTNNVERYHEIRCKFGNTTNMGLVVKDEVVLCVSPPVVDDMNVSHWFISAPTLTLEYE